MRFSSAKILTLHQYTVSLLNFNKEDKKTLEHEGKCMIKDNIEKKKRINILKDSFGNATWR